MAMHPDAQHKAQEEIDTVIGPDRLPHFNDREKLPYINAIVEETLRWHSIVPTGKGNHTLRTVDITKSGRCPACIR